MTVVNEPTTKRTTACGVKKVIKTSQKSIRLSRKRLSTQAAARKTRIRFTMSKKPTVKRTNSQLSVGPNLSAGGASVSRCEEQLDAAIFRTLTVLTKRHQPTDEFRAQFCRGAFLKPNTKAFIQVMHFLFNVYDAREFRKRFYWPIYDKGAENAFRTSTVEYVNSLIERGKLVGMEKIKAHVVVLPGGAKFMKFLLTLIKFVLQEELRRAKASSGLAPDAEVEPITKTRIAQMIASHKRLVDVSEGIRGTIREDVAALTERTRKIESLIETVLQGCDLAQQMNYDKLMLLWDVRINTQHREQQKIRQRMQAIADEYDRVVEKTESKLKANELTLPFTKEQLKDCLDKYTAQPGMEQVHQHAQDVFDGTGKLHAVKLLQLLSEDVLPSVEQFFGGFCVKNPDVMKYEQKELSKVAIKFDELRQQIDMLQRSLPPLEDCQLRDLPGGDGSPDKLGKDNFAIKNKLFCTPPIVMDFDAQSDEFHAAGLAGPRSHQRLALLNREDVHAMNARMKLLSVSSYQLRSPKPAPKHLKPSTGDQSNVPQPPNATTGFAVPRIARKEKLNPLTMLNRIKAQSQKQCSSSRSNGDAPPVNSTMNISTLSEITLRPEFSSTLLGTPEKCGPGTVGRTPNEEDVERKPRSVQTLQVPQQQHQQQIKRMVSSPTVHSSPRLMAIYAGSNTPKSTVSPKTLLRGPGGQRTSLKRSSLIENESTVHTSPSGRLESLVKHDELPLQRCLPLPLALEPESETGITNSGQELVDTSEDKTLRPENGGQTEDLSRTLLAISAGGISQIEVGEAECKPASGEKTGEDLHIPAPDEDDLFNVSDGVVTDFE
nr:augmin complex subunit dgt6 [Anopheles coluzzii]